MTVVSPRRPSPRASAHRSPVVIFAGGGSGGHISPGLAIAERLALLDPSSRRIFLCSQRTIDSTMLTNAGAEYVALPATPPSASPIKALAFWRNFRESKSLAYELMLTANVTHVVALGGFVAAPVVAAAHSLNLPVTLINLDARPGKANRWIAKRSTQVLSAVPTPDFPNFAHSVIGMPVRRSAIATADAHACRTQLGLDPALSTLLITGASQGASSINQLMIAFARSNPQLFERWQILHLSGSGADETLRAAYHAARIRAVVQPFLHEVGNAWGAADLALSRAGANSVAEVIHNRVPCIFLPYPHHRDMHQLHNARPIADSGGAIIFNDLIDPEKNRAALQPILADLLNSPHRISEMKINLDRIPAPDAALHVAGLLLTTTH